MTEVPSIVAERYRLDALNSYDILDTAPETGFDEIVLLAREICDTPVALLSLLPPSASGSRPRCCAALCAWVVLTCATSADPGGYAVQPLPRRQLPLRSLPDLLQYAGQPMVGFPCQEPLTGKEVYLCFKVANPFSNLIDVKIHENGEADVQPNGD